MIGFHYEQFTSEIAGEAATLLTLTPSVKVKTEPVRKTYRVFPGTSAARILSLEKSLETYIVKTTRLEVTAFPVQKPEII